VRVERLEDQLIRSALQLTVPSALGQPPAKETVVPLDRLDHDTNWGPSRVLYLQHPDDPVVYKNQVTVTMAKVGGQWLVDDLTTNGDGT